LIEDKNALSAVERIGISGWARTGGLRAIDVLIVGDHGSAAAVAIVGTVVLVIQRTNEAAIFKDGDGPAAFVPAGVGENPAIRTDVDGIHVERNVVQGLIRRIGIVASEGVSDPAGSVIKGVILIGRIVVLCNVGRRRLLRVVRIYKLVLAGRLTVSGRRHGQQNGTAKHKPDMFRTHSTSL